MYKSVDGAETGSQVQNCSYVYFQTEYLPAQLTLPLIDDEFIQGGVNHSSKVSFLLLGSLYCCKIKGKYLLLRGMLAMQLVLSHYKVRSMQ